MLYIIGGTSRAGKTTIAKYMLNNLKIPYLSLDSLVMGFTNGLPEFGINDKLPPAKIADKIWNFIQAFCENLIWIGDDYIIEGEAILPHQVAELLQKYPDKVKACYVGYTTIDINQKFNEIKKHNTGENDWLNKESDMIIKRHIKYMAEYSTKIKTECNAYGIAYFDTSLNYEGEIHKAVNYLNNNRIIVPF